MERSQRKSRSGATGARGGRAAAARARSKRPIVFGHPEESYARLSTQPLYVLVFLLPLLIAYEIGSAMYLSGDGHGGVARVIRAEGLLTQFFRWFGVGGLYLPGIALIVVLLIWHMMTRAKWTIRLPVLGWMFVESLAWTPPLVVLLQFVGRLAGGGGGATAAMLGAAPVGGGATGVVAAGGLEAMSVAERATIAVGAGLYEELLFRMLAIAGVHIVASDLMGMKDKWARLVAVVCSAAAFGFYHDVFLQSGGLDWGKLLIFFLAGLYFGGIYVVRGFGIVVATHALYDLAVLILLPSGR